MSNVQGQIDRISGEVTAQASLIAQIQTALEGKAAGGGTGSVEWQDVFALPTTYIVETLPRDYYVEKPNDFHALIVRGIYNGSNVCDALVSTADGSAIKIGDGAITLSEVSGENVICITVTLNDYVPTVSPAEYLII